MGWVFTGDTRGEDWKGEGRGGREEISREDMKRMRDGGGRMGEGKGESSAGAGADALYLLPHVRPLDGA
eukprot:766721-Hanusia_phi.AAC.5